MMISHRPQSARSRGILQSAAGALGPVARSAGVWQGALSLSLFVAVFGWTARLRGAAIQLDLNYRLAAPDGVTLLIPPFAPGVESTSALRSLSSGRFLADALSSVGLGSGFLTELVIGAVLIFIMMMIATRLLMLPQTVAHMAAWSLPLLLLGGAPFPSFGYFGLPPDVGPAIGGAAGVLAIGFLYRLGLAHDNREAAPYAAGFLGAAIVAAGLTPFGLGFAAILLTGGFVLVLTSPNKTTAVRMIAVIAFVIFVFATRLRDSEAAFRTFIYANPVPEHYFSGMLSLMLGRTPLPATTFAALLFAAITAGAVCVAWGKGNQRAVGGMVTIGVIPLAAVLFALEFRYPQLRSVDYRAFDSYMWPILVLALASALQIIAVALAKRVTGRPNVRLAQVFSIAAVIALAVIALAFARQRAGVDEREAFWLNAAQTNSWQSAANRDGFAGYTFALTSPAAASDDVALYSAPGFQPDTGFAALAPRASVSPLTMTGQSLTNFARRADAAGSSNGQLFGLLANWGVASVINKPAQTQATAVTLPQPNINGFSPSHATVIPQPDKALAWLAENGFARRDWVVADAALPEQLSPARNMRFIRSGADFRVQAEADGASLMVLPVGYDLCRMRLVAGSWSEERPRLVLINLAQAGIVFSRKLDATIEVGSQNTGSSSCRQATKALPPGADAKGLVFAAPPPLLDLPAPAVLTLSSQSANGGQAAIKITNFSVSAATDLDTPLPKHPDQHPAYAIDGDGVTFWSTGMMTKPRPVYLQFDLDTEARVDGLTLLGRHGYPTLLVAPDQVETSSDGQAWQPAPMKVTKSEYAVVVDIEPAMARHVRLRMTQGEYSGNYYDQISEISAFAKDAASKTLTLSWRSPLGGIAGSKVSGYRLRWSAQPAPGVDCSNCKITGIPMPSAGRYGTVESALVPTGMLPPEAQYVSVVGIDVNGKVLAVSNSIAIR